MNSISFQKITYAYPKQNNLFQDLSFTVRRGNKNRGHIVGLMGNSGSGKTTLLKLLLGTLQPFSGAISTHPETPIIAYVPQYPVLFEHLSVTENARFLANTRNYRKRFNEKLYGELVAELALEEVVMSKGKITDLSGGQQQRLSLLRALSVSPDFLLLDEPTTGLDAKVKVKLLNKIREIADRHKMLMVYVTHHRLETELIMDEVIYLYKDNDNPINSVFQMDTKSFVTAPPVAEAATVFNFPNPNQLRVLQEGQIFRLPKNEQEYQKAQHSIFIQGSELKFTTTHGVSYNTISSSDMYVQLSIGTGNNRLNLPNQLVGQHPSGKLEFTQPLNVYRPNGLLVGRFTIF